MSPGNPPSGAGLPAVGILCNADGDPYSAAIMCGAAEKLGEHGFHTVCLKGGFPSAPLYLGQAGVPVVPSGLRALISLSATLRGLDRELEKMAAHSPQVVVSIGANIANTRVVAANDEIGVFQAVAHLVKCHDRKKIAFISGPEGSADAAQRLTAYRVALQTFNLQVDPALIVRGDYEAQSGHEAVLQLRRFGNAGFDAIVAANDLMAIGAIEGLRAAQLQVPRDVAVIGFDDTEEASFTSPGLTTIRQPVYEQGLSAVRLLMRHFSGESNDEQPTLIPSPLVIRGSCGCNSLQKAPRASLSPLANPNEDREFLDGALRGLLRRELVTRRMQRELSRFAEEIMAASDFPELARVLAPAIRLLDLRRFLLCLYTKDQRGAHVVLESSGREVVFRNQSPAFPVQQLLPSAFLQGSKPLQVIVEPLKVRNEHFGYMVLEADLRDGHARLELRHFLSSALSRIARERELRHLYTGQRRDSERRRATQVAETVSSSDAETPEAPLLAAPVLLRRGSGLDIEAKALK